MLRIDSAVLLGPGSRRTTHLPLGHDHGMRGNGSAKVAPQRCTERELVLQQLLALRLFDAAQIDPVG
ncbi:MAG TPA: hypothetical protein VLW55_18115, partial [Burkholderiaceae bacterium]|nr:hypothetical protein [Burkholderiaceae bacterium]